jgi:hypothetical protein
VVEGRGVGVRVGGVVGVWLGVGVGVGVRVTVGKGVKVAATGRVGELKIILGGIAVAVARLASPVVRVEWLDVGCQTGTSATVVASLVALAPIWEQAVTIRKRIQPVIRRHNL